MQTKETPSFTQTSERHDLPNSREQELEHGVGSLRHTLLQDVEGRGSFIQLPGGTVAVEANTADLSLEDFFSTSDKVKRLQDDPSAHEAGASVLNHDASMLTLDERQERKLARGESDANMTLIYERQGSLAADEVQVPSAALVHAENLSVEEIARIRENLPDGVPLIDAKTNELLDDTGVAEREKGRVSYKTRKKLGKMAFFSIDFDSLDREIEEMYQAKSQERAERNEQLARHARDFYDSYSRNSQYENLASTRPDSHVPMSYFTGKEEYSEPKDNTPDQKTETKIVTPQAPESEEVRAHREKVEAEAQRAREVAEAAAVYDEAKVENNARNTMRAVEVIKDKAEDLYGTSNLTKLDDEQLKKVEKKTAAAVHPDKAYAEGGDLAVSQEAAHLFDKFRKAREAGDIPPPPDNT